MRVFPDSDACDAQFYDGGTFVLDDDDDDEDEDDGNGDGKNNNGNNDGNCTFVA